MSADAAPPELLIVGSGRSGTTVVLEASVASLPSSTAIPRLVGKLPQLAWIGTSLARRRALPGAWSRPSAEATALFREAAVTQELQAALKRSVTPQDVPAHGRAILRHRVEQVRRAAGVQTVVIKNTASCGRVPFLHAVFPEGRFMHVVRRPSGVVASLLRTEFFYSMQLWWDGRTTLEYAREEGIPFEQVAARHWTKQVTAVVKDLGDLPPECHLTLQYEAFTAAPSQELSRLKLFGFSQICELGLESMQIYSRPEHEGVSPAILEAVELECGEVATSLGLDW